jgi:hypothetical protein
VTGARAEWESRASTAARLQMSFTGQAHPATGSLMLRHRRPPPHIPLFAASPASEQPGQNQRSMSNGPAPRRALQPPTAGAPTGWQLRLQPHGGQAQALGGATQWPLRSPAAPPPPLSSRHHQLRAPRQPGAAAASPPCQRPRQHGASPRAQAPRLPKESRRGPGAVQATWCFPQLRSLPAQPLRP